MKWHFKKGDNMHIGSCDSSLHNLLLMASADLASCMYNAKGEDDRKREIAVVASAWQAIAVIEAVIRSHDKDVIKAGREKYDSDIARRREMFSCERTGAGDALREVINDLFGGGEDE